MSDTFNDPPVMTGLKFFDMIEPIKDSYGQPIFLDSWVEVIESTVYNGYIVMTGKKKYITDHHEFSSTLRLNAVVYKVTAERLEELEQMRKDEKVAQIIN